ncbi:DNA-3-methyladenine glycosylase I, partial [Methanoculleus sp.]|uniref:DNA-3-methyladenine glycosylase I n=1 Tax=Methanoculleus sp. TaxID=90427 RepID=UPI0025E30811
DIIFYSGFRASVVSRKIDIIHSYFSNYEIVKKYSSEDIEKICNDSKMIKNRLKIEACIKNAKRFEEIVNKYGSFKEYINFVRLIQMKMLCIILRETLKRILII